MDREAAVAMWEAEVEVEAKAIRSRIEALAAEAARKRSRRRRAPQAGDVVTAAETTAWLQALADEAAAEPD